MSQIVGIYYYNFVLSLIKNRETDSYDTTLNYRMLLDDKETEEEYDEAMRLWDEEEQRQIDFYLSYGKFALFCAKYWPLKLMCDYGRASHRDRIEIPYIHIDSPTGVFVRRVATKIDFGFFESVNAVRWSDEGVLATGGDDRKLKLWNPHDRDDGRATIMVEIQQSDLILSLIHI